MIYCYICECDALVTVERPMSESGAVQRCRCGRPMRRDYMTEGRGHKQTCGNWPMESDAAGVNPEQIAEAREYNRKMGVPTEYNPETGAAIFTSREHRKRFCEISGLYDRNGGYGDQAPHHNMRKRRRRRHAG